MTMPKEVREYFINGKRRLVEIKIKDNYVLLLKYDNDEIREYDLTNMLTGVLTVLKDKNKFNEVFIDSCGNIAWDIDKNVDSDKVFTNRIDLSADNAYIYGERSNAP
jgi:bifunctional DNA-binding transcriptional regulator/antitoxin component of YhaV-PrlF toxin-antitoxin module